MLLVPLPNDREIRNHWRISDQAPQPFADDNAIAASSRKYWLLLKPASYTHAKVEDPFKRRTPRPKKQLCIKLRLNECGQPATVFWKSSEKTRAICRSLSLNTSKPGSSRTPEQVSHELCWQAKHWAGITTKSWKQQTPFPHQWPRYGLDQTGWAMGNQPPNGMEVHHHPSMGPLVAHPSDAGLKRTQTSTNPAQAHGPQNHNSSKSFL